MNEQTITGLINNTALLITLVFIYDSLMSYSEKFRLKIIGGFLFGLIGIAVMKTPLEFMPGIIFDTRSILISVGGYFMGFIPALIAMIMTSAFRIYNGGAGMWTGVAVIITSGIIGLTWRYLRRNRSDVINIGELYLFGIAVHAAMLLWMLSLPWPIAKKVLSDIGLPVMIIYPAATVLLGKFMAATILRKQAEEQNKSSLREKEILLKELHHRVKNNMQIITSLLNLQAGQIKNREARDPFLICEKRIRSMALVHEKLYKSKDMTSINFNEYMHKLIDEIFSSNIRLENNVKFTIDTDNIFLSVDKAIPAGLIINELVSNALKHAFTEKKAGIILVEFLKDKDGNYTLTVKDNGKGLPDDFQIRKKASLGYQLVDALTIQLNGKMDIFGTEGTKTTITFPA